MAFDGHETTHRQLTDINTQVNTHNLTAKKKPMTMTRRRKKYTNKAQNNRCVTLLFCRTTQDEKPGNCTFVNVGGSWLNPPSMEQIEVLKTA